MVAEWTDFKGTLDIICEQKLYFPPAENLWEKNLKAQIACRLLHAIFAFL